MIIITYFITFEQEKIYTIIFLSLYVLSCTDSSTFPLILAVSPMFLTGLSETLVVPSSPLTGNPPSTNF